MIAKPKEIYDALTALSGDMCVGNTKCDKCKMMDAILGDSIFESVWINALLISIEDGPEKTFALLLSCGIQIGAALREAEVLNSLYVSGSENDSK